MRAHRFLILAVVAISLGLGCGGSDKKYMIPVDSPARPFVAPDSDDLGASADDDDWSTDEDDDADEAHETAANDQDAAAPMRAALQAQQAKFAACYQQAHKKDPKLSGDIAITLQVTPAGAPASVKVSGGQALAACVSKVVQGVKFPKPSTGEMTEVRMPLHLQPAK